MVESTGLGAVWPRPQRAVSLMVSPRSIEALDVALLALAAADALEDLEHPLGADAAGRALAAGLVLREVEEEAGHVDHAGVLVHDDHAAGAHDGAELLQRSRSRRAR